MLRVPFEDWPPYSFTGNDHHPVGVEIDILDAIVTEAGCAVQWVPGLPRKRRWLYFKTGELDLLLAASDSGPAGARVAMFSRPYRKEIISAFVLADGHTHPYVDSLADMLAHRVPVVAQTGGDGGFPMADRFVAAGLVTRYEEYSRGVQLLQLHRGDVMIGDRWAVAYAANLQHVALRCLALDITHDEVAYMLSRKTLNTADLNAINQAIGRLTANGTLDRIRHRWLASERPGASQQANSLTP